MDQNLNVPSIESIRGDKSRPITRVHRVPSSRESSPTRQHPIMAKELLATKNEITPKMIIFMCGLPATGKSYMAKKIKRYLNWIGFKTEVFNVGNRRRLSTMPDNDTAIRILSGNMNGLSIDQSNDRSDDASFRATSSHSHKFFDPTNQEAKSQRDRWALEVLEDVLHWLSNEGHVAIHDATNSTVERRARLIQALKDKNLIPGIVPIFIESSLTDENILNENIKMKLLSPDYRNMSPEEARADFLLRRKNYEKAYDSLGDKEKSNGISFIKIINVGRELVTNRIKGFLESQLVFYLMNISIKQRTIWLTTHGESYVDESTGERRLTRKGKQYADALAQFQQSEYFKNEPHNSKMEIWTSMLGRSIEMAEFFPSTYTYKHSMLLNELYPGEFDKVNTDSNYESVIIERLRPVLIELERMPVSVTIIARDVVLGALCAYFFDVPAKDALKLRVPLHTAVCLKPKPFGTEVLLFEYDQEKESFYESVGTWREILGNSSTETFID